ncbi:DUF4265 domain-containing protein [Alteromonas oceanisediminis]|uniref:DUF4265 domain-containing protein n=1 Tax=Alteromonas oceanisediminis TaxID=2836180 RepID=UPI001BDA520C|nr:DUF4265 domain-containing protein [Alteromonas oceanisediminis]MBT0588113.1 DUF4265 domain-containing protein [Alteromonas oceanisediminis]
MEKVLFALDIEDEWPPVGAEGIWCERVGEHYQLKNVPFFLDGLANEDIFSAEPDPVNDHIFEFELIKESGHSVISLLNNIDLDLTAFFEVIVSLGCSYEGFAQYRLYAIDVPPNIDIVKLNHLIDAYEELGIDFAFPVWRFD